MIKWYCCCTSAVSSITNCNTVYFKRIPKIFKHIVHIIFFTFLEHTWYRCNVKNLEIYCQRLKKILHQHLCASKHSQSFYDPMNLQNNFCILYITCKYVSLLTNAKKRKINNLPSISFYQFTYKPKFVLDTKTKILLKFKIKSKDE